MTGTGIRRWVLVNTGVIGEFQARCSMCGRIATSKDDLRCCPRKCHTVQRPPRKRAKPGHLF